MIAFFENTHMYYVRNNLLKSLDATKNNSVALDNLTEGKWYHLVLEMNDATYLGQFEGKDKSGSGLGSTSFRFKVDGGHIIINQSNVDLYKIYEVYFAKESNIDNSHLDITVKERAGIKFKLFLFNNGKINVIKRQ